MKKLFTFIVVLFAALSVNAATSKTIWTGSETFDESWSGSFKIESTEFADLKAGDKVFITAKPETAVTWQWGSQVFIKTARDGWDAIVPTINVSAAGEFSFEVSDDEITIKEKNDQGENEVKTSILKELQEKGMIVQGIDATVTKVSLLLFPSYEAEGTAIEFDQWGQIYKDQLANFSGDDKIVFTYEVAGTIESDKIGWGIGYLKSLGGNITLAEFSLPASIGQYSVAFTMDELEAALADPNTQYNTYGVAMNLWGQGTATASRVSCVAFKAKGTAPASDTWTVAGSGAIFGSTWSETDTANDMTSTDGVNFTFKKENVTLETGANYEFKVVKNHSWDENYPAQNYIITVDETAIYTVTINFNADTKEITHSVEKTGSAGPVSHTYSVIGTINGDWNVDTDMTKGDDGLYTATFTDVKAGSYKFKVRVDHDWSISYPGSDYELTVDADGSTVTVTFNEESKEVKATVTSATGIQTAKIVGLNSGVCYNLAGQKVNASYKGLVIKNGKKVVVK